MCDRYPSRQIHPDGSREVVFPDRSRRRFRPDGSEDTPPPLPPGPPPPSPPPDHHPARGRHRPDAAGAGAGRWSWPPREGGRSDGGGVGPGGGLQVDAIRV